MNKKVLIASDSTCDLTLELIKKFGIKTLPLTVILDGKEYKDGLEIDPDKIYEHYENTKQLPKTSAINIGEFSDFFAKYTSEGYAIVLFTISAQMSSTYNNARIAASEFDDVYVVDSQNLSTGGGLLVLKAADMANEGKSAKEIFDEVTALREKVNASFVIDSLEFLYKGGRCSALAAFGANLLNLKPCIAVSGGKMGVCKKYRGSFDKVLRTYIADRIGDGSKIDTSRVFITHAGCKEEIYTRCIEQVKSLGIFDEVLLSRAGCTVSAHCGRNTLGVLFIEK